jgi:hypothetical protein
MKLDTHTEAAKVAAILAARGFSARVVKQNHTHGVEVSLEDSSAIWTISESGWSYAVLSQVDGGVRVTSSGFAEVGIYDEPERVAWVVANFPYDSEMTEDEAREAVAGLISQVYDMTDEERQAILEQAIPSEDPVSSAPMNWSSLADSGALWAINRLVFNPMGFSLALRYEEQRAIGWVLVGDGAAPVQMEHISDLDGSLRFRTFIQSLLADVEG